MGRQLDQDPNPGRATDQLAALELISISFSFPTCEMALIAVSTHWAWVGKQKPSRTSNRGVGRGGQKEEGAGVEKAGAS